MSDYLYSKRKAAHWLLSELIKATFIQNALVQNGERTKLYSKQFLSKNIEELQPKGHFTLEILRDAVVLLDRNGHIKISGKNTNNEDLSQFKATIDGEFAYKEEYYLRLNRDDTFKKRINSSNFWTPILTLFIAVLALIRTFYGCDKQTIEVIHTDKPSQTSRLSQSKKSLSQNYDQTKLRFNH